MLCNMYMNIHKIVICRYIFIGAYFSNYREFIPMFIWYSYRCTDFSG